MTDALTAHREANALAADDLAARVKQADVEFIYYQFVSINGRVLAKVVPASHLRRSLEKGVQFHGSAIADVASDRHGELFGIEHPLKQQHGLRQAGLAQLDRFLEASHGKRIRIGQCLGRHHAAVPIGVGLYHRHDAGTRGLTTHHGQVVPQCRGLNHRANGCRHQ